MKLQKAAAPQIDNRADTCQVAGPADGGPVPSQERIEFLDELRGLAVLGMASINIVAFGTPSLATLQPELLGELEVIDKLLHQLVFLGFEGSFRAIFCVLFGIGVLMQFERLSEKTGPARALVLHRGRMRWLVVFGLVDAYLLLWFGDILFLYGLIGLFLLSFRNLAASRLSAVALLLLVFLSAQNFYFGEFFSLPKNQLMQPMSADLATPEAVRSQMIAEAEAEVEEIREGYLSAWPSRSLLAFYMQLSYLFRGVWEALALMLLGMACYKSIKYQPRISAGRYAFVSIIGFVIGLAINLWEIDRSASAGTPVLVQFLWTYDLGRLATALGFASLLMLLSKLDLLSSTRALLAATGRMALSNYLLQSVIYGGIFVGLGLFGQLRFLELYFLVTAVWALQLILNSYWLRHFRSGPMEWTWRSLVLRERQAFLRGS